MTNRLSVSDLATRSVGLSPEQFAEKYSSGFLVLLKEATDGNVRITQVGDDRGSTSDAGLNMLNRDAFVLKRPEGSRFGADYIGIGRGENNAIVINDSRVSKFHAFVVQEENAFKVSDAGSKNGTYLNGIPVPGYRDEPASTLADGDTLIVGSAHLTYLGVESFLRLCKNA